jgi:hypothetical protein
MQSLFCKEPDKIVLSISQYRQRALEAGIARLRLLGRLDRVRVLLLVAVAERVPCSPGEV